MRLVLAIAGFALAACSGGDPAPSVGGISPNGNSPVTPDNPAPLVLETPAETETAPETPRAADAPLARTVFDVDPLGRFEVVTWEEAARRADARVTAANVQAELNRLRVEILGRRR